MNANLLHTTAVEMSMLHVLTPLEIIAVCAATDMRGMVQAAEVSHTCDIGSTRCSVPYISRIATMALQSYFKQIYLHD